MTGKLTGGPARMGGIIRRTFGAPDSDMRRGKQVGFTPGRPWAHIESRLCHVGDRDFRWQGFRMNIL